MREVVRLGLLILSTNLLRISCFNVLDNYLAGRWYKAQSYGHSERESSFFKSEKECIFVKDISDGVFHCESEFNARLVYETGELEISCNVTLESGKLRRDFYSIMEMNLISEVKLHLISCPEPLGSYQSLFKPFHHEDERTRIPTLDELRIECGSRKDFALEKKHFEGMSALLKLLEISCHALVALPADIFEAGFPNLVDLTISNTQIKNVPDGLFIKLNGVEKLTLRSNEIFRIEDDDFRGLDYLERLFIDENNLNFFGENSFEHIKDLVSFSLFHSKVDKLPSSFGNLVSLKTIHLTNNSIKAIEGICDAFSTLREVVITNNSISHIDFECFNFREANSIDLSRNSLSILPNTSILMDELLVFELMENKQTIPEIHQFIASNNLERIEMQFSMIEAISSDFLHNVPALKYFWMSNNKISYLHKDLFAFNPDLEVILLSGNRITHIPDGLLRNNLYLFRLDLSLNQIKELPSSLFYNKIYFTYLRLEKNLLESIPENLLVNLTSLQRITLSNNRIKFIYNNTFVGLKSLQTLDIANNFLNSSVANSFWPFKNFGNLANLYLNGNSINHIPPMDELTLRYLNLANNSLQKVEEDTFFNLKRLRKLDLSRNGLENLPNSSVVNGFEIEILKLSFNKLHDFPSEFIPEENRIFHIDLRGNRLEIFDICTLINAEMLQELHLSENRLHQIGDLSQCSLELNELKLLNLSHNQLSFSDSLWSYDLVRKTWGRISPLLIFPNVEEIYMANNSISTIFMDWRNMFLKLRQFDLSHNKINVLTHQDLLFTSTLVMKNGTSIPYPCHHTLFIDLQFNQINKLELPTEMLVKVSKENDKKLYGHVTINIDNNPFHCGCEMINFLRLLDGDVALISEIRRTEEKEWVLSANIQVGNLSCWLPETVRGKNLANPQTWMHHILPTLGACSLLESE